MNAKKTRVALGMSGGVDSATSAAILLSEGYDVIGVTCLFLEGEASRASAQDAKAVCDRLGIEHVVRACAGAFEREVISPFVDAYGHGLTPSPCVRCNERCKVPQLVAAADELGCEKIATGHYARVVELLESGRFVVRTALDGSKDQSYMLATLDQCCLERLILPLGGTTKAAVRACAEDLSLPVAHKPESQDICFVSGEYADFLAARGIFGAPGDIVDASGRVLGRHNGLERYTVGQRKGIGIGGAAEPYYVIAKDVEGNRLVVGFKDESLISKVELSSAVWQAFEKLSEPIECMVKLRYRSQPKPCLLEPLSDGLARASLLEPQDSTAPGQIAVFYQGSTVLGGGTIVSTER